MAEGYLKFTLPNQVEVESVIVWNVDRMLLFALSEVQSVGGMALPDSTRLTIGTNAAIFTQTQ
jgi:hypothetical protein